MTKRFLTICLVSLVLVALFIPSCTPTTGTIEVKATLDGSPWTGSVNYTLTPASGSPISGTSVAKNFTVAAGNWTCAYVLGGPGIFVSITPTATQSVAAGETKAFTLNFVTPEQVNAYVTFQTWTINGLPVVPGPVYWLNPGDWIDAEYSEHVSGQEEGALVPVHQTSWLKIHNTGIEGEQGPDITLHVVNAPGAVTMNPPADSKRNQQCTVEGAPVDVCTQITLHYCEPVNLDVEVDWELKVCTNYTKTINWIGYPPFGPMILAGAEVLFDATVVAPFQTVTLVSWACVEVGEGFEDTNPDDDCCQQSPPLLIGFLPPPP